MSLKTPMQYFVHTAEEAFVQAERDCKRRGRGANQKRLLVLHGQWSGEKAFDLCQNLQRETRGSITITAAISFLDAVTRKEVEVQEDSRSAHNRFARTRASEGGPRDSLRSHLPTASRRC